MLVEKDRIGRISFEWHSVKNGHLFTVLDRLGEELLTYGCPSRQWGDVKRACRALGYPWKQQRLRPDMPSSTTATPGATPTSVGADVASRSPCPGGAGVQGFPTFTLTPRRPGLG